MLKDMKFKISMAPTPEQMLVLKQMLQDRLPPGVVLQNDFWCDEKIVTVDEALELFQFYKLAQLHSNE